MLRGSEKPMVADRLKEEDWNSKCHHLWYLPFFPHHFMPEGGTGMEIHTKSKAGILVRCVIQSYKVQSWIWSLLKIVIFCSLRVFH